MAHLRMGLFIGLNTHNIQVNQFKRQLALLMPTKHMTHKLYVDVLTQEGRRETFTLRTSQKDLAVNLQKNLQSLYQWDVKLPTVLKVYNFESSLIA